MGNYHVIYMVNFTPNDWYKGKNIIPEIKFDDVEADSVEEAKHKAEIQIEKMNVKNDKGSTENRLVSIKIIN